MKWISVKDRLPDNRTKVLFSYNKQVDTAFFLERYVNENWDVENVFRSSDGGVYTVKYFQDMSWMPLPSPPITE